MVPVGSEKSGGAGISVSVIIPVYNTEVYLRELLDSLVAQDLPVEQFEVIAVNDGSTDASGEILDEYANRYPNFRVLHQENSGWAGKPRNVALDLAQGQYVFFADSDDVLAPSALRQMSEFASEHKIDVVFPKVVGIGGRTVSKGLYTKTNPSISPLLAINTLTPQKLISRELIESNRLRFPEEPVRLEDGMFMVACYLLAEKIGVAADQDLYSLRARADGSNISSQPLDPYTYTASISKIAAIIRAEAKDDELAHAMTLTLWSNKGLKIYAPARFKRYSEEVQNKWMDAHSNFVNEFITDESARNLSDIRHGKTEFIRNQDKHGVLGIIAVQEQLEQRVVIDSAHYVNGELQISGTLHSSGIDSICISARNRGGGPSVLAEATLSARNGKFDGTLSGIPEGEEIIDFFLKPAAGAIQGSARRAPSGTSPAFSTNGSLTPYRTKYGNFSLQPIRE
ncbi:hypothetical protein GCM10009628_26700 [Paeniglutamicibacter kerguelensis]|nr:glycosyltransferase [Paeniglutamicibacter kerguelensis]